jgi:hypothetical protein
MTTYYLPGWGLGEWGSYAFGGIPLASTGPVIISRYPAPNQFDVGEDTTITVQFFDANYDLDTTSIQVDINDVIAYSGVSGFSSGFTGKVTYTSGVVSVRVTPLSPFEFGQTVKVHAGALDSATNGAEDTWSFTIRENPICYIGNNPLPIETDIQSPLSTFLYLEQLRTLLFNTVLKNASVSITNRENKAARAIYQLAFSTELSTVLNLFDLRNEAALRTTVCEKQTGLAVDKALTARYNDLKKVIASFKTLGAIPDSYITNFYDYLDSSLYSYRVSLAANLLLLGKSLELQDG